jgi:hypothetical protein
VQAARTSVRVEEEEREGGREGGKREKGGL